MKRRIVIALSVAAAFAVAGHAQELPKERKFVASLQSTIGPIKVELLSAEVKPVPFLRRTLSGLKELKTPGVFLLVKIRVANDKGAAKARYEPWHSAGAKRMPTSKDEFGGLHRGWTPGPASWPIGGVERSASIEGGKSITDFVAFPEPNWLAEEIDLKLPAANVGQAGDFKFKIARAFFEDAGKRKTDIAAKVKEAAKAEEERVAQAEKDKVAKKAKERLDKIEAQKPKITRANYDRIQINMRRPDVEKILGPGKETSRNGTFINVSYRGQAVQGVLPPVIQIMYRDAGFDQGLIDHSVVSKSMSD